MSRVVEDDFDDESEQRVTRRVINSVRTGPAHISKETAGDDPFTQNSQELKLSGLSTSVAKKATRQVNKYLRGTTQSGQKVSSKQDMEEASAYNYLDVVQPHYNLDYLAKLYEVSSANGAAIRAKASNVVGLGYKLTDSEKTKRQLDKLSDDEDGLKKFREKVTRIRSNVNEALDLFNEEDDFNEILLKAYIDYEATGQGYIEVGRGDDGSIGMIAHVPATTIRVRRQRDGFVQIVSNRAVFFRNFGDRETSNPLTNDPEPNELIMVRKYSPTNTYYGIPDIVSAIIALAGNEFSAKFNLDYFENKAVPRHLIVLKGAEFSYSAEQSIVEFFETGLKGKNHRSLYVPLPGDSQDEKVSLEIKPIEAGIQDQSFAKYKMDNLQEILMAHGVPMNKVGLSSGVSVASALEASRTFKNQISTPEQRRWSKKVNRIVRELTDYLDFEFNEMTLTDEDTQSKIDERNVRNDIELPNEVRARKGLPPIADGNKTSSQKAAEGQEKAARQKQLQQAHATQAAEQTTARDAERSADTSTTSDQGRAPSGEGRRGGE